MKTDVPPTPPPQPLLNSLDSILSQASNNQSKKAHKLGKYLADRSRVRRSIYIRKLRFSEFRPTSIYDISGAGGPTLPNCLIHGCATRWLSLEFRYLDSWKEFRVHLNHVFKAEYHNFSWLRVVGPWTLKTFTKRMLYYHWKLLVSFERREVFVLDLILFFFFTSRRIVLCMEKEKERGMN